MTPIEKEELTAKIKKVMVDHLTTVGYPDITNEQIISQLKPMWIKLEESGLPLTGMNFNGFVNIAQAMFMIAEINEQMGI